MSFIVKSIGNALGFIGDGAVDVLRSDDIGQHFLIDDKKAEMNGHIDDENIEYIDSDEEYYSYDGESEVEEPEEGEYDEEQDDVFVDESVNHLLNIIKAVNRKRKHQSNNSDESVDELPQNHDTMIKRQKFETVLLSSFKNENGEDLGFKDIFDSANELWKRLYEYENSIKGKKIKTLSFTDAVTVYVNDVDFKKYGKKELKEMKSSFSSNCRCLLKRYLESKYFKLNEKGEFKYPHKFISKEDDMVVGVADKEKFFAPIAIYSAICVLHKTNNEIIKHQIINCRRLQNYNKECEHVKNDKEKMFQ